VIRGSTQVYAVLGDPVAHSLSPALHRVLLDALGRDAVYVALRPTSAADPAGADLPRQLRSLGLAGANVTAPFKAGVAAGADVASPLVARLGAANTLVVTPRGVEAHNTDAPGLVASLHHRFGDVVRGARAVVCGAGGAGVAAVAGLVDAGADRVHLLNRSPSRARDAAQRLGPRVLPGALDATALRAACEGADLVVVATRGRPDALETPPVEALASRAVWCDLNYWMADPPGMAAAREVGLRTDDGRGMLAWQALLAAEHLYGARPGEDIVPALLAVIPPALRT
jgi:shikimate dehydrogenase